jgi:hypothetical protein
MYTFYKDIAKHISTGTELELISKALQLPRVIQSYAHSKPPLGIKMWLAFSMLLHYIATTPLNHSFLSKMEIRICSLIQ